MTSGGQHSGSRDDVRGGQESRLVQRLRQAYHDLPPPRPAQVFAGYSGGSDSLALLVLLGGLARTEGFALRAIHVDHGVREESARDREVAESVAGSLGVPIEVRVIRPGDVARHAGVGGEEAMRRERYRAFADIAGLDGAIVALAHHERDQAETVLLHLMRGAGIRGASGMRSLTGMRVPWWDEGSVGRQLTVWRPLLGASGEDVRTFAESTGLPIAVDASNSDESYRRNAVRHTILPPMEQVFPGATRSLARFAALAGSDSDYLDLVAEAELERVRSGDALDRRRLVALPVPIRLRVVRAWIAGAVPAALEISSNRLDEVIGVAARPGPERTVELGHGWNVIVARNDLVIEAPADLEPR